MCCVALLCHTHLCCLHRLSSFRIKYTYQVDGLNFCATYVCMYIYIYVCVYVCVCTRVHVYSWFILFVQFIVINFFFRSWRASTQRSSFTPSAQMTYWNLLPRQTWRSASGCLPKGSDGNPRGWPLFRFATSFISFTLESCYWSVCKSLLHIWFTWSS